MRYFTKKLPFKTPYFTILRVFDTRHLLHIVYQNLRISKRLRRRKPRKCVVKHIS